MFKRSVNISPILKKRILEQDEEQKSIERVGKRKKEEKVGEKETISQNLHKRGRHTKENLYRAPLLTDSHCKKKIKHSQIK